MRASLRDRDSVIQRAPLCHKSLLGNGPSRKSTTHLKNASLGGHLPILPSSHQVQTLAFSQQPNAQEPHLHIWVHQRHKRSWGRTRKNYSTRMVCSCLLESSS